MKETLEFSLRDKDNIEELNNILDSLYLDLSQDEKKFKLVFKNLPIKIYLKIDSLRSVSTENKSDKFKEVVEKAKDLSKKFHAKFK